MFLEFIILYCNTANVRPCIPSPCITVLVRNKIQIWQYLTSSLHRKLICCMYTVQYVIHYQSSTTKMNSKIFWSHFIMLSAMNHHNKPVCISCCWIGYSPFWVGWRDLLLFCYIHYTNSKFCLAHAAQVRQSIF